MCTSMHTVCVHHDNTYDVFRHIHKAKNSFSVVFTKLKIMQQFVHSPSAHV